MDLLQKQIAALSAKIDALHQIVEQLDSKVIQAIAAGKLLPESLDGQSSNNGSYSLQTHRNSDPLMQHKDVLVDGNQADSRSKSGERQLSPEVQIQRLTAQLTAAYNQIAALEERLLAQRERVY
ncbi:MAG: hypothetical protein KME35_15180 [Aphanocapsa sp. GSE-SYN-MK-11-07L]|nr:hypothetical protein [Aphanocapsa sp. GSE-SYN-MK-11-07L]